MKTIVIIDDDARLREVLTRRFRAENYEVQAYPSATAALASSPQSAFALFLDMMLEEEVGLDFVARLKQHFQLTHLIIMTGYASIASTVRAMKDGATDYVTKPVAFSSLVMCLKGETAHTEELQPMTPAQAEWEHIQRTLAEHQGNISATAKALGLHRRTLQRKLQKLSPKR